VNSNPSKGHYYGWPTWEASIIARLPRPLGEGSVKVLLFPLKSVSHGMGGKIVTSR
jgi:hypothetical protein